MPLPITKILLKIFEEDIKQILSGSTFHTSIKAAFKVHHHVYTIAHIGPMQKLLLD